MAITVADRVKETTSTTGSGTITLDGASSSFQSFSGVLSNGEKTYYCIQNSTQFEVGRGTYSSNTLTRDLIFDSSDSKNLINIGAQSEVFIGYPASGSVLVNEDNRVQLPVSGLLFGDGSTLQSAGTIQVTGVPGRIVFIHTDNAYTTATGLTFDQTSNLFSTEDISAVSLSISGGSNPNVQFLAPTVVNPLTLNVRASGTGTALTFDGTEGTLFKIEDNLSTGVIFSISDISGFSLIQADASGDVKLIKGGRYVGVAHDAPEHAFDVSGVGRFSDGILSTGLITAATGVELHVSTPATTSNKLYNVGGALYFNGCLLYTSPSPRD